MDTSMGWEAMNTGCERMGAIPAYIRSTALCCSSFTLSLPSCPSSTSRLVRCHMTPFVLDHMPVWPHLLSLAVESNENLNEYSFEHVAERFPSLTSLSSPNCSDAAVANIVRLPALEELRFPDLHDLQEQEEAWASRELTSTDGLQAFNRASKLRSIYYTPLEGAEGPDIVTMSLTNPIALFTLANLTRLTIPAAWFEYTQEQYDVLSLASLPASPLFGANSTRLRWIRHLCAYRCAACTARQAAPCGGRRSSAEASRTCCQTSC